MGNYIDVYTGKRIDADDYNLLQGRVDAVMGTGSGDTGYGQTLTSSQVNPGDLVQATHLNNLFSDIRKAYTHQLGVAPTLADVAVGAEIDAGTKPTPIGWMDYDTIVKTITDNRLSAGETMEEALQTALTSTKTNWNANIFHEISITFSSANQRRWFFNSGGQIWFFAEITGATETKTLDWISMFNAAGTVKFAINGTSRTGASGTAYAIGNNQLTVNYQTIFQKTGSGVYAANDWTIKAKREGDTKLWFRIEYNDDAGPNPNFDEANNGTLSSYVRVRRSVSSNVSIPAPTYAKTSDL